LTVPAPHIVKGAEKIYDLAEPTAKMSKSASSPAGVVDLLDDPKISAKKIRSAVTDTGREIYYDPATKPGISNLLVIYSALSGRSIDDLVAAYDGKGYGALKSDVGQALADFVTPLRQAVAGYTDDPAELDKLLARGAERARDVAGQTLRAVYNRVGFLPPTG
jgi:tryptophanyl-tRNA synthetase